MRTFLAVVFFAALCGATVAAPVQPHRCGANAPGVSCDNGGVIYADLDGDGVADKMALMRMPKLSALGVAGNVTVISTLWGKSRTPKAGVDAMLMIVLGKSNRVFMLTDEIGYFDTPIWESKDLPMAVAKRGSKEFKEFQSEEPRIKNDIFVLGTEAGIDTALYWNGKTFALFEPAEEP